MNPRLIFGPFAAAIFLIAAGWFPAREAHGGRAYLPAVGSPPLRFQDASTNDFVFNSKEFIHEIKRPAPTRPTRGPLRQPTRRRRPTQI
jgi:hypothetical protein